MNETPFSYVDADTPLARRILIRVLEKLTGARAVEKLYLQNRRDMQDSDDWWSASLRTLRVTLRYDAKALDDMPREGALVIMSNHPFGVLDGIALASLVHKVRSDYLVLTNAVLLRAPEIRDYVLPVDFEATPEALKTNVSSRARARAHLAKGGALIIFPAGEVATSPDRFGRQPAVEKRWQPIVAQLVEKSRAHVLPVCFHGQNSRLFQICSHIHLMLRLALFFHELRRHIGKDVLVTIGDAIPYCDLPKFEIRQALADHLQTVVQTLSHGRPLLNLPPSLRAERSNPGTHGAR
jgi:putative hemolysin